MAAPYELLLRTGCRRSEILSLEWGMVFDDRIDLPPSMTKNKQRFLIYLTPSARKLIGDRPKDAKDADQVFPNHPAANTKPVERLRKRMNELAVRDGHPEPSTLDAPYLQTHSRDTVRRFSRRRQTAFPARNCVPDIEPQKFINHEAIQPCNQLSREESRLESLG